MKCLQHFCIFFHVRRSGGREKRGWEWDGNRACARGRASRRACLCTPLCVRRLGPGSGECPRGRRVRRVEAGIVGRLGRRSDGKRSGSGGGGCRCRAQQADRPCATPPGGGHGRSIATGKLPAAAHAPSAAPHPFAHLHHWECELVWKRARARGDDCGRRGMEPRHGRASHADPRQIRVVAPRALAGWRRRQQQPGFPRTIQSRE